MNDPFQHLNDGLSLMRMQNELMAKDAQIDRLQRQVESLREAGDKIWYCLRHIKSVHADEIKDSTDKWNEARNGIIK